VPRDQKLEKPVELDLDQGGSPVFRAGAPLRCPTTRASTDGGSSDSGIVSTNQNVARDPRVRRISPVGRRPPLRHPLDRRAYHLNHGKHGRVMFDVESGTMLEGIGHYGYLPVAGENRIVSTCRNPYPCDFDLGILTAMAKRFAPDATVDHVEGETCRKSGADECTYVVTWPG
jgi:hypothetical protein